MPFQLIKAPGVFEQIGFFISSTSKIKTFTTISFLDFDLLSGFGCVRVLTLADQICCGQVGNFDRNSSGRCAIL
ncbi:hypothetical protein CCR75_001797 [Bremia lactucae]|uniref:Uncharacterized protein n=1 Tax=Bremia lactucae TaxID=4779 RepID=A0A976IH88_BRELC|nr:hypothetical protein CCR75_001797 [Bremia lactucae]